MKKINKTFAHKSLVLAMITCLLSLQFHAQDSTAHKKLLGGFGYMTLGWERLSLDPLNNMLATAHYGQFKSSVPTLGGAGAFVIHNIIVGGGGSWLAGQTVYHPFYQAHLSGGYGHFDLGYIVWSRKRTILYPLLAVGGGGFNLEISEQNFDGDFNKQLNSPKNFFNTNAGGMLLDASVTLQSFVGTKTTDGILYGIRIGYKYAPSDWSFNTRGNTLGNAPKISMSGPYVTLTLGFGGLFHLK